MMRIRLITLEPALERAVAQDLAYREAMDREDWPALASAMQRLATLRTAPARDPRPHWGGYLVVDDETDSLIGSCAFKSAPTGDGVVEIAYFTYPGFEGRGYATEMAKELLRLAGGSADVRRVIAHTLPAADASTRVLEKVGMSFVGEVVDPEDGCVWEWERRLAT